MTTDNPHTVATDKKIGIIGVGLMGHGIAANIQKSGWQIGFLNHPGNQPTDDLTATGAVEYLSIAEITHASDTLIICVTGSSQVEAIIEQADGVLSHIRPGTVVIDCSTAIPASTIKIAKMLADVGARFLDAPMTRTPREAALGKLNLIVGGDKALFDEQLPLLQAYAENITHAGDNGAGHTLKLVHNFVSLGFSAVLAEAVATANKAGINCQTLRDVLANGGGASVVLDRMAPYILNEEPGAFEFSLSNSAKDMNYYQQMCKDYHSAHEVASAIESLYFDQVEQGNGEHYVPHLISLLDKPE